MGYHLKKTGLQKSKDEAVYQYLIDHATPTPFGYKVWFIIKNRGDWEGRIKARMNGKYRNDERKLEEKAENAVRWLNKQNYDSMIMSKGAQWMDEKGSWWQKIAVQWYRKLRTYVYKTGERVNKTRKNSQITSVPTDTRP